MTVDYLFYGYLAGFLLLGLFVLRLALRLGALEKRLARLGGQDERGNTGTL